MSQQIQKNWPARDGAQTQVRSIVVDLLGAVLSDRPLFRVFYHTHELTKYPIHRFSGSPRPYSQPPICHTLIALIG